MNGVPQRADTDLDRASTGFSLVEILVVIAILGILASVTVLAVRGATDESYDNACGIERKALGTAVEAYFAREGRTDIPPTGTGDARFEHTLVDEEIIRSTSDGYVIAADGSLTAQADGPCA